MKEITVTELHQKMENGENLILLDVREPYEHEEYDIGGINIPLGEIRLHSEKLKEFGDRDIVLYCRSGNRSGMAQKLLSMHFNINNTSNLKGGLVAWSEHFDPI